MSTLTNTQLSLSSDRYQELKRGFKRITDINTLKEYISENDIELGTLKTSILNTWLQIPEVKIYRRSGALELSKITDTRYRNITVLKDRIDALERESKQIKDVIETLIVTNQLKLKHD